MEGLFQCGRGRGPEIAVSYIEYISMWQFSPKPPCCVWLQSSDYAGRERGDSTGGATGAILARPNHEGPTAHCDTQSGPQEKGEEVFNIECSIKMSVYSCIPVLC